MGLTVRFASASYLARSSRWTQIFSLASCAHCASQAPCSPRRLAPPGHRETRVHHPTARQGAGATRRPTLLSSRNRPPGPRPPRGPRERFDFIKLVEAARIELASETPWRQASTAIVRILIFALPCSRGQDRGRASLSRFAPRLQARPRSYPAEYDALTRPLRAQAGRAPAALSGQS